MGAGFMESPLSKKPLADLHVLISGGTTGIGRAAALALAKHGSHVFVFGRHKRELTDTLRDAKGLSGPVIGSVADQSDPSDVERVFAEYSKAFPKLDVLVNNAGIGGEDLKKESDKGILYTVQTNFCGYLFCARRALKMMKKRRRGHIVNIGSINAEEMEDGGEIYTGTKAAIRAFSEAFRKSVQKSGIKVSLIEPGSTGTDMSDASPAGQRKAEAKRKMLTAEDIADAVCYILTRPPQTVVSSIQIVPLLDQEG
jgi:NADP-dependent 3-hydroxy acid dehydrogenase YdfG